MFIRTPHTIVITWQIYRHATQPIVRSVCVVVGLNQHIRAHTKNTNNDTFAPCIMRVAEHKTKTSTTTITSTHLNTARVETYYEAGREYGHVCYDTTNQNNHIMESRVRLRTRARIRLRMISVKRLNIRHRKCYYGRMIADATIANTATRSRIYYETSTTINELFRARRD